MFATVSSPSFAYSPKVAAPTSAGADPWSSHRHQPSDPIAFITLIRTHHRAIFHLTHALLRDEVAAERITQQVFARARRRLDRSPNSSSVVEWIYYASLRFVRMYHRKSGNALARRRQATAVCNAAGLDLHTLVRVMVRQPGKLDPRDCELLALRHVLGLSLANIGQLLRLHPYEVSNRLSWAHERLSKLEVRMQTNSPFADTDRVPALALSA